MLRNRAYFRYFAWIPAAGLTTRSVRMGAGAPLALPLAALGRCASLGLTAPTVAFVRQTWFLSRLPSCHDPTLALYHPVIKFGPSTFADLFFKPRVSHLPLVDGVCRGCGGRRVRRPDGAESQCRTERVRRGCGEGVEGVEGAQGTAGAVASVGLAGCTLIKV